MKTASTQLGRQDEELERLAIETMRTLAMDAVQMAGGGIEALRAAVVAAAQN